MSESTTLTFKSEEERTAALDNLPVSPPQGTTDLDDWERDVEAQEQAILNAQIVEEGVKDESVSRETVPTPEVKPPEPKVVESTTTTEEPLFFGRKKSELPEALRKYNTEDDMLEQMDHARRGIDRIASERDTYRTELEKVQARLSEMDALQKKIEELEKKRDTVQKDAEAQGPVSLAMQSKIDNLSQGISKLKELQDDDYVYAKDVRPILDTYNLELSSARKSLSTIQNDYSSYRKTTDNKIAELEGKFNNILTKEEKRLKDEKIKQQVEANLKNFIDISEEFPELKTSRKPFAFNNTENTVERSLVSMCEKLSGKAVDGPAINRIVNAYLKKDPQVINRMKEEGVLLNDYNINEQDIKAYALMSNIDACRRGWLIDKDTGQTFENRDIITGNMVTFPDNKSAYNYLLDKYNIRKKEIQEKVVEAEKRGAQSLESALARRDTTPETLGNVGSGSTQNLGTELSAEQAEAVLKDRKYGEYMQRKLLAGDTEGWELFTMYNKALKRLGYPEEIPEPDWRKPKAVK